MRNHEVAQILYEIADLLEIKGVRFKPRAYRKAAQAVESLSEDIQKLCKEGKLEEIPGVGSSIAEKIREFLETGGLRYLSELRGDLPKGVEELMKVGGIGPKTALFLNKELKISNVEELEAAVRSGKLRKLKGFGRKTEENILRGIELHRRAQKRVLLGYALPTALEIVEKLAKLDAVGQISPAGSLRRGKETIGDVDILVTSKRALEVMDFFVKMPPVKEVLAKGETKSSIILTDNLQVDLRVVEEDSFGSALQYFTGSKEHNIKLRERALKRNLKLSEYGLFERDTNKKIAGRTEESVYEALGLKFIEPELREDRGEIEAAETGNLPSLVSYDSVKGDLHVHTNWSDGTHSIEEMAEAARSLGYEYLGICDHSKSMKIAHGLTEERLVQQNRQIQKINEKIEGFTILSGIEVDIKPDGSLDLKDNVLKDLDIVVASVHSGFKSSRKEMTKRIVTAIHNDYVDVLGHPTGRIINRRDPYQVDLHKIFEAASDCGILMEINAFPNRLDLRDVDCQTARDYGLKMAIGTDAHNRDQLKYIRLGVATARRGWLEPAHVVNTLSLKQLRRVLRKS